MLELYLLNVLFRITNSNYPLAAEKISLRIAENISIPTKGKRKRLFMEISPADVYSHNYKIFGEGRTTQFSYKNYITLVCLKNIDLL